MTNSNNKKVGVIKYPRFSEQYIKNLLCSQKFFERGKRYYECGRVSDIDKLDNGFTYRATVRGSYIYNCELQFNGDFLNLHKCNCPAHETYPGPCKHVVAVLLKIRDLRLASDKSIQKATARLDSADDGKIKKTTQKDFQQYPYQQSERQLSCQDCTQNSALTTQEQKCSVEDEKAKVPSHQKSNLERDEMRTGLLIILGLLFLPLLLGIIFAVQGDGFLVGFIGGIILEVIIIFFVKLIIP